ncbi:hypothetical protein [Falsiroseomonas sp.]|uniref:hypothetical protein n=1 Tax=Falsiroseomonas sp. TaxID=2870721 RepID=UPI0027355437|nr:hypothetical protein [Falsiroseomonas sp.]MDP3416615.1 hypothetical protein [Falsiroseomonas sp.]
MERHVERLVASCGLAQFSYRTWPSTEITVPEVLAEPVPSFVTPRVLDVAVLLPDGPGLAVVEKPGPGTAGIVGTEAIADPKTAGAAGAPAAPRARSLLASLYRLIETPPMQPALTATPGSQRTARLRGPLALPPPEGFEAPIHVGERPPAKMLRDRRDVSLGAHRPPPGGPPAVAVEAVPARRFALLDELAPAPPRYTDRRAPPPSTL